jgi:uncharacterized sporulation protein YeaH/YhbH (DUF444 family)
MDLEDFADGTKKKKIGVPAKDLKEYQIVHGSGGEKTIVHPGNKEFEAGDRIPRPPSGGGGGSGEGDASNSGEGDDQFIFELTQDEVLDAFFEDMELPDMIKENIKSVDTWSSRRAGFVNEGSPSRLNIERSMRKARGRRLALRGPKRKKLRELEAELEQLNITISERQQANEECEIEKDRRDVVTDKIERLKRKIKAVPFVDDMDLQYNNWTKVPVPTTKAVMFCVMDVSGSMGEWEKEMAKRFYLLLYLFLLRSYEKVDIVYIRHHTVAKEVDHDEFFYSRETGGTLVSPALDLMNEIIKERYDPTQWNLYTCQASDGDNWGDDNILVEDMMRQSILPVVQYYAYVEIKKNKERHSALKETYDGIDQLYDNFATTMINDVTDIFPVFQKLFEKRDA